MKLSYNKVFDRYTMSFSDKLAESSYSLYRTLRLQLAKIFPLSEHEKYRFDDDLFSKEEAADMPQGFDYIEKKDVDSFVKLDYQFSFVKTKSSNNLVLIFPYLFVICQPLFF
mgnify:CR=1 FL=1